MARRPFDYGCKPEVCPANRIWRVKKEKPDGKSRPARNFDA
jgi:hypothetical protein